MWEKKRYNREQLCEKTEIQRRNSIRDEERDNKELPCEKKKKFTTKNYNVGEVRSNRELPCGKTGGTMENHQV